MFRVSTETIARWEMEATGADGEVVRPLVATDPPVRRFADVVRAVVKTMELAGFGGNDLIARTLARAGWKLSARTVGRIRRECRAAMGIAGGCGGAMGITGRPWRLETRATPSVSFSIRLRKRAFCPDGDLGSSNRPFSMKAPRSNGSAREPPGPNPALGGETAVEQNRLRSPTLRSSSLEPGGWLRAQLSIAKIAAGVSDGTGPSSTRLATCVIDVD
jgi:hypothetical protein